MRTYVFFRYTDPTTTQQTMDWSPQTVVHEHPDQALKRMSAIIGEQYDAADLKITPVPTGMLFVYFSSGASEQAMPQILEYTVKLERPKVVQLTWLDRER